MSNVSVTDEWVLGVDGTPFFTKRWSPANGAPKAFILFVHGFCDHVGCYDRFFPLLAAPPYSFHITAYDQRGHGRTAHEPLVDSSPDVKAWKTEGKTVKLVKNGKRLTGGWAKALPDMEFFVRRESTRAGEKELFLWGHSMGGGQSLAFATRSSSPPSQQTVSLLSGIIVSAPLIRQTHPAPPARQTKMAEIAAKGNPDLLVGSPVNWEFMSHDPAVTKRNQEDPMRESVGSISGVMDMIKGGISLDTAETWDRWPKGLGLMMYHGTEDEICCVEATKRFYAGVQAKYKRLEILEGMRHEPHIEIHPMPTKLAGMVAEWIDEVIRDTKGKSEKLSRSKL